MDITENSAKFNGWNKLPRWLNRDLLQGKIAFDELALLIIYVMNADWDSRHKIYSATNLSDRFLGKCIDGLYRNKVALIRQRLTKKGYIKK